MENDVRPQDGEPVDPREDELDDAVSAADDTGMVASQQLLNEEEILEHTEAPPGDEREEPPR